jgi:hypothetical protein
MRIPYLLTQCDHKAKGMVSKVYVRGPSLLGLSKCAPVYEQARSREPLGACREFWQADEHSVLQLYW